MPKRHMSAAARQRIADAQRERWAKWKANRGNNVNHKRPVASVGKQTTLHNTIQVLDRQIVQARELLDKLEAARGAVESLAA